MRVFLFFSAATIILTSIFFTIVLGYENIFEGDLFLKEGKQYLSDITESERGKVSDFLAERKNDAEVLSKAYFTRNLLENNSGNIDFFQERLGKEFLSFYDVGYYESLSLVDSEGNVVYFLGEDENEKGIYEIFLGNKGIEQPLIFQNNFAQDTPGNEIFILSPVISENDQGLGMILLELKSRSISDLTYRNIELRYKGRIYFVNRDGFSTSISNFDGTGETLNKYESGEINECFLQKGKEIIIEDTRDYFGNVIIGTYLYLPELEWCAAAEICKDDLMENSSGIWKILFYTYFSIALCILLIIIILDNLYELKGNYFSK